MEFIEKEIITIYKEPEKGYFNELQNSVIEQESLKVKTMMGGVGSPGGLSYDKIHGLAPAKEIKVYIIFETNEKYVDSEIAKNFWIINSSYFNTNDEKYYQISDVLLTKIEQNNSLVIKYINIDKSYFLNPIDKIDIIKKSKYNENIDLKDNYYIDIEKIIELGFKKLNEDDINRGLYGHLPEEELSILNSKYVINIEVYDESKNRNK